MRRSTNTLNNMLVTVSEAPDVPGDTYRVELTLEGGRTFVGWLRLDGLSSPPLAGPREIAAYGRDLFYRLFAPPLDDAFYQALATAQTQGWRLRVQLRLNSDDSLLHEIPWEMLHYDPSAGQHEPLPLACDPGIAFSRYIATTNLPFQPLEHRPLKLLVFISAPIDLGPGGEWPNLVPIDKALELHELETPLNQMRNIGQITYTSLPRAAEEDLHLALSKEYDALLYFGHALHHPAFGTRLVLEDAATREATLYEDDELVQRLRQSHYRPSLVMLVACNTATQRRQQQVAEPQDGLQTNAPTSLAARLVGEGGVPAVLAMQNLVDIQMARSFSHFLNDYLLRHGVVDVAVSDARRQVYERDTNEWSTPVLYMRTQDGRLFAPNAHLEYMQALAQTERFTRWQGNNFIAMEAVTVPPNQSWQIIRQRPRDAPPSQDAQLALLTALALDEPTSQTNLVVLLGAPRSGQTTNIQRLAWHLADQSRQLAIAEQIIPIYVPLDYYDQQRGGNRLEAAILQAVSEITPTMATELEPLLLPHHRNNGQDQEQQRYIFLLDGLDAVSERQRVQIAVDITSLQRRLPAQRFLISSTFDTIPPHFFRRATILLLQPLNERLVLRYLRQRAPERAALIYRQIVENRLLDIATDPSLLQMIFERLDQNQSIRLTQNQLLQSVLDELLGSVVSPNIPGNVERQTINALAWEFRWRQVDTLSLTDVFAIMAAVRQDRDYSLETLYRVYRDAGLLSELNEEMIHFAYPAIQAYCAALALYERPDLDERLDDILAMCGMSTRLEWWSGTLCALAGLLEDPRPLFHLADVAVMEQSSTYTLLLAQLLQSLSAEAERTLTGRQRLQLLDICAIRLRPQREPLAERRAQIASALGNLNYPKVIEELGRVLTKRVRPTGDGWRYDVPQVRIAATRALRVALTQAAQVDASDYTLMNRPRLPTRGSTAQPATLPYSSRATEPLQKLAGLDPAVWAVFRAWHDGTESDTAAQNQDGRSRLRAILLSPGKQHSALERAIAAFALGDMAAAPADARLMFAMIVRPRPADIPPSEWGETIWGAAGALTLFDAHLVADLVIDYFTKAQRVPEHSIEQLAYIVGRVRAQDVHVLRWLVELLLENPDHAIKSRALQSLAWMGQMSDSDNWLKEVLATTGWDSLQSAGIDSIQRLVEAIAAWQLPDLAALGSFTAPVQESAAGHRQMGGTFLLRRVALEALALVGGRGTIQRLEPLVEEWPLPLRQTWHHSSAAIRARLSVLSRGRAGIMGR